MEFIKYFLLYFILTPFLVYVAIFVLSVVMDFLWYVFERMNKDDY